MRIFNWRIIPIVLFLMLSFFLWRGLSLKPHHLPSVQIGKVLPSFVLPQLEHPNDWFKSEDLPHQPILLNIWASWCAACVEEQVLLLQLARQGVLIYGLNYKDSQREALNWLQQWGNPYRAIGQDREGKAAIDLGVYGAPETFVIDKRGVIRYRHVGVMNQKIWLNQMVPLMRELEKET
jgi:cytochrome c biogenesis protein CcmG/thiol:disulfide interchange protein DsbE